MKFEKIIIQELIKIRAKTLTDLAMIKRKIAKKYKIPFPSNTKLLQVYQKLVKNKNKTLCQSTEQRIKPSETLERLFQTRPIRSLSGIVSISVLTKPFPCPGKCLYCPTQKGMPKSYLDNEPAVMRAVLNNFNPYNQVQTRLRALELAGHPTDKIELIVIGGTWSYLPKKYQTWFIKHCFDACNKKTAKTLKIAQKLNEKAKHRIIGITLETRPDFISREEIKRMRKLGVTRVEIGVQSIYDEILKINKRGHTIKEVIQATKFLKDAGFKVCYHMMPNLFGSNLKKDEKMFEEIFENSDFRPDFLKIYPCVVVKEAELYKIWKKGNYKPYTNKQLIELLKNISKKIPLYCRVIRIIRDIPSSRIAVGSKISNLREIITVQAKKEGWQCRCIRCREIRGDYNAKEKLKLFRQDYNGSQGKEIFLSFENKSREKLYALLRLRIPSYFLKPSKDNNSLPIFPILKNAAIIREVHTYGQLVPISQKKIAPQHKGLGKKLIKQAEKIVKNEFGINKIAIISGVGTRNYYRKLNYRLKDEYMVKNL